MKSKTVVWTKKVVEPEVKKVEPKVEKTQVTVSVPVPMPVEPPVVLNHLLAIIRKGK